MKKIIAVFLFLALTASMTLAADGTWTGWITDAKCAPKVGGDCAKKCVEKGEKMVFVDSDSKTIFQVANQDSLRDHVGHHVTVKGTLDNGTLTVSSVKMVPEASK
ncbi:MAG TPA: hypothetical protein VJW20_00630 [Candidatus Angelobacter sp.]|nr:hypothetical protein [Candidatus Angelobacter sp.]